ncbi:MAG: histidine kinase [Ferruginibacter sp.]
MNKRIFHHIVFWFLYLMFEVYVEFAWIRSSFAKLSWQHVYFIALSTELLTLVIKIPLSYCIIYMIRQFYEKQKSILLMAGCILGAFIVAVLIYRPVVVYIIYPYLYHEKSPESLYNINRCINSFLDLIFIVGVAFALKQYRYQLKWREIEKSLTTQKLTAELNFLKAQTNPHFLFNTLNNIYALARKKSDDTADVVMKLSKLLRFMLYESQKTTIPIIDEIHVLDDYIELEKIRYDEKLKLTFTKSMDNESQMIAPLILLPFVENAFKHGASESRFSSYINIGLKLQQGELFFFIENSKSENLVIVQPENIGLNNIRRQLELLYPDHNLDIESNANRFTVSLKINLDKHASV